MPTQRKSVAERVPAEVPDAQTLVGKRVECPGDVFNSPGETFRGVVTGTPKTKGRSHSRCYVRFEGEDTTEYWFPSKEVVNWLVEKGGRAAYSDTPIKAVSGHTSEGTEEYIGPDSVEQPTTSDFETTDAEIHDEYLQEEEEDLAPGVRAAPKIVQQGAEYGIPLGVTLAVLVLSGLLWFFCQLWVSEKRMTTSSIPNSS